MIKETKQILHLDEHLDDKTLLVLDIDETLIQPTSYVGSMLFENDMTEFLISKGSNHKEARKQAQQFWSVAQHINEVSLIEQEIIHLLEKWQSQIPILGLTARDADLATITKKQLSSVKIAFFLEEHHFPTKSPFFHHGILFCEGTPKGESLFSLLGENHSFDNVKKIVAVDDRIDHLENIRLEAKTRGYQFMGLHYTKVNN